MLSLIVGIVGIVIPVVGMTITPTRNLILGLAPEEVILQLADKIDETRVNVDQNKKDGDNKIQELQLLIDSQKSQIEEQQKTINEQSGQISSSKSEIQTVQNTIVKNKDCSVDVNKYCVSDSFTDPDKFKKFLKNYEQFDNYSEYKDKYTKQFNKCQEAIKCN